MSAREKVCAQNWMSAAMDAEDAELAKYWQDQGLQARMDRLAGPNSEPIPEPPVQAPKRRRQAKPMCDLCGSTTCVDAACLL